MLAAPAVRMIYGPLNLQQNRGVYFSQFRGKWFLMIFFFGGGGRWITGHQQACYFYSFISTKIEEKMMFKRGGMMFLENNLAIK